MHQSEKANGDEGVFAAGKYQTSLRDAQRALTRGLIKGAARELLYNRRYESTTVDEIASSAKVRRATLYLHYKDKIEIFSEIVADYAPEVCNALANLPGPRPSEHQLNCWIGDVIEMVGRERMRISIFMELRQSNTHKTSAIGNLTTEFLSALGTHNPIFQKAARDDTDPTLLARALLLLQQLTYVCEFFLDENGSALGKSLIQQTAKDFRHFLDERHTVPTEVTCRPARHLVCPDVPLDVRTRS